MLLRCCHPYFGYASAVVPHARWRRAQLWQELWDCALRTQDFQVVEFSLVSEPNQTCQSSLVIKLQS